MNYPHLSSTFSRSRISTFLHQFRLLPTSFDFPCPHLFRLSRGPGFRLSSTSFDFCPPVSTFRVATKFDFLEVLFSTFRLSRCTNFRLFESPPQFAFLEVLFSTFRLSRSTKFRLFESPPQFDFLEVLFSTFRLSRCTNFRLFESPPQFAFLEVLFSTFLHQFRLLPTSFDFPCPHLFRLSRGPGFRLSSTSFDFCPPVSSLPALRFAKSQLGDEPPLI